MSMSPAAAGSNDHSMPAAPRHDTSPIMGVVIPRLEALQSGLNWGFGEVAKKLTFLTPSSPPSDEPVKQSTTWPQVSSSHTLSDVTNNFSSTKVVAHPNDIPKTPFQGFASLVGKQNRPTPSMSMFQHASSAQPMPDTPVETCSGTSAEDTTKLTQPTDFETRLEAATAAPMRLSGKPPLHPRVQALAGIHLSKRHVSAKGLALVSGWGNALSQVKTVASLPAEVPAVVLAQGHAPLPAEAQAQSATQGAARPAPKGPVSSPSKGSTFSSAMGTAPAMVKGPAVVDIEDVAVEPCAHNGLGPASPCTHSSGQEHAGDTTCEVSMGSPMDWSPTHRMSQAAPAPTYFNSPTPAVTGGQVHMALSGVPSEAPSFIIPTLAQGKAEGIVCKSMAAKLLSPSSPCLGPSSAHLAKQAPCQTMHTLLLVNFHQASPPQLPRQMLQLLAQLPSWAGASKPAAQSNLCKLPASQPTLQLASPAKMSRLSRPGSALMYLVSMPHSSRVSSEQDRHRQ